MHVKVLDERVVRRAKARGLDALVYAPHFTPLPEIERRAAFYTDSDLLVVPGREVFTGDWRDRKHLLAVGLSRPIPDFVTLEGALLELEGQDAATLVPHPEFLTVSLDGADVERYRSLIDGVEIYNPKFWPHHGTRAATIAEETSLPAVASSYAHLRSTVGEAWTAFDTTDVEPDADALATRGADARSMTARSPGENPTHERAARDLPRSARSRRDDTAGESTAEAAGSGTAGAWLVDRTWSVRVEAFTEALRSGVPRSISHRTGIVHRAQCVAEFSHLGYENSLTKAIRVLRPRLPATHPGHPLYEGRFDDVRVY